MADVLPTEQLKHSPTSTPPHSTHGSFSLWGQRNTKSKNGWNEQRSLDPGYIIHWLPLDTLRFGFPSLKSKMYLLYELLWGLSKKEDRFKYCLIPLTDAPRTAKFKKTENCVWLPGAGRSRVGSCSFRLESPSTWGSWRAPETRCWSHSYVKVTDGTAAAHQKRVRMVDFVRHILPS